MKRFMLLLDLKPRCLVSFESGLALETINQDLPVVPFCAVLERSHSSTVTR